MKFQKILNSSVVPVPGISPFIIRALLVSQFWYPLFENEFEAVFTLKNQWTTRNWDDLKRAYNY